MRIIASLILTFAMFFVGAPAVAQLNFNETTDGELSDDLSNPDELVFGIGVNTIAGNVGSTNGTGSTVGTDADFFTFSLAPGQSVDSISIARTGGGFQSFIGYVAGTSFPGASTGDLGAGDLDGNTLFSDGEALLPGGLLSSPLTEGDHAFWIQETGSPIDYAISFNVVPEPDSAMLLVGLGLGVAGLVRRRR